MLFNSIPFLIFLPTVFFLYWFVLRNSLSLQNGFLLLVSYIFYGWWDYRFLALILFSTLVDYLVGIAIPAVKNSYRTILLGISLLVNLGLLGFFKYYNFFIESWVTAWEGLNVRMDVNTLDIILPVGISFYTFQTLSYTIDIYRKQIKPNKNFIEFAAYVSFFPQLVAGPIERAAHLLPQFKHKRKFDYETARSGLYLILWGLFQKVVIADSCATYVNAIFSNYEQLNGLSLVLGAIYFALQIYGDFAGYSNIAIGIARLFGFDLMRNFNYPYFSRNIAEFWRRWHISLTTWFRDYLYIPLGGSRGTLFKTLRNVIIIFLVSGFWHGANWTFLFWGGLNALYFIPLLVYKKNRNHLDTVAYGSYLPSVRELLQITTTFALTCFAWIFFRSASIEQAINYIKYIGSRFEWSMEYLNIERYNVEMLPLISLFLLIEWFHRFYEHPLAGRGRELKVAGVLLFVLVFGVFSDHESFIYFQF